MLGTELLPKKFASSRGCDDFDRDLNRGLVLDEVGSSASVSSPSDDHCGRRKSLERRRL